MPAETPPVLYLIACGAPPARQLPAFVIHAQQQGWDVCVIATPEGTKFLDAGDLAGLTGHPVRVQFKHPDEPDVLPPPDAIAVAPATFNTINKWAQGISDTLALGLLNEAVGLALPMVAVPWPNAALARHPVFQRSLDVLREWGVTVLLDPARLPQESGEPPAFPWVELRAELPNLRAQHISQQNTEPRESRLFSRTISWWQPTPWATARRCPQACHTSCDPIHPVTTVEQPACAGSCIPSSR